MPIPHPVPSDSGSVRCGGGGSCSKHPQQQPGEKTAPSRTFPLWLCRHRLGLTFTMCILGPAFTAFSSTTFFPWPHHREFGLSSGFTVLTSAHGLWLVWRKEKYSPILSWGDALRIQAHWEEEQGQSCGPATLWSFYSLIFDSPELAVRQALF